MKPERGGASKYARLTADQLATATAEFDQEMVVSRSRALTPAEKQVWKEARRKPGRPKKAVLASGRG